MSFERHPKATASTTTDTPVIIEPGYTVQWPQQVVLTIPNTEQGLDGWESSFIANGSGVDRVVLGTVQHTSGKRGIRAYTYGANFQLVNPAPTMTLYRTVRGLIPGRQYRLSARIAPHWQAVMARIRMGGQVSPWNATTTLQTHTVTFTAVADEEDIVLEAVDNPALNWKSVTELFFADLTLTGLPFTQTVPPVVDDQIDMTVYNGKLTADAGWAPFIQGDVTVPLASDELGAALDPNAGSRFNITASSIRELTPQWHDWSLSRRNLHPDPGHTGPISDTTSGQLYSCYTPLTGNHLGTTDRVNNLLTSNGTQHLNVRHLPAGSRFGYSVTIQQPLRTSTQTSVYLDVFLSRVLLGTSPTPSTLVAVLRVTDLANGGAVIIEQTSSVADTATTRLLVEQTLSIPNGPDNLRIEVFIENRGTTAWTSSGAFNQFAITTKRWAVMDGNVAIWPVVEEDAVIPPAKAGLVRYLRDGTTTIEEVRLPADPIIDDVDERVFDLALTEKVIDYDRREMRLSLASDEYLLQRFAKPADDATPRTREHSLRSVIEYVLGEALGVAPPLSGTADADVTARWAGTNMITNPVGSASLTGWVAGGTGGTIAAVTPGRGSNAYRIRVSNATAGFTGGPFFSTSGTGGIAVSGGQSITATCWVRSNRAIPVRIAFQYVVETGSATNHVGPTKTLVANTWTKLETTVTIPSNVIRIGPYVYPASGSYAASSWIDIDEVMVYETTDDLTTAFNGNTPDGSGYTYEWSGDAFGSESRREPIDGMAREREALTWSAGDTAWDFLTPLVSSAGLRLFCDSSRVWHLIDPETYTAPGSLAVTPANTVEALDVIDGERGDYADGVVIEWSWTDHKGIARSRTERAGTEGKIAKLKLNKPYPGAGTAAAHLAKLQRRASVRPVTVATDYRATPDQAVSITLPSTSQPTTTRNYSAWTEVRRNTIQNPKITNTTGWTVPTGHTLAAGGVVDISATAGTNALLPYQATNGTAAPGEVWSQALEVAVPTGYPAVRLRMGIVPYGASGAIAPYGYTTTETIQPGTSHRFTATHTMPEGTTSVRLIPYLVEGAAAGRRVIYNEPLQVKASTPGDYFDGGTNPTGDVERTRWLGLPNASVSVTETRTFDGWTVTTPNGEPATGELASVTWDLTEGVMQLESTGLESSP